MKDFYTITELAEKRECTVFDILNKAEQGDITLSIRFKDGFFVVNKGKHHGDWIDCHTRAKIIDLAPYYYGELLDHYLLKQKADNEGFVDVGNGIRERAFHNDYTFHLRDGILDGKKGWFHHIPSHLDLNNHMPTEVDGNGKILKKVSIRGVSTEIEDILIRASQLALYDTDKPADQAPQQQHIEEDSFLNRAQCIEIWAEWGKTRRTYSKNIDWRTLKKYIKEYTGWEKLPRVDPQKGNSPIRIKESLLYEIFLIKMKNNF